VWTQRSNEYGGIPEIGDTAEYEIAGGDEQIENHIQPEKVAQPGSARGQQVQHQPRQ
jgi:hypothetical protein